MSNTQGVEANLTQLPDAIVVAYAASSMRVTGTEGEEHAVVVVEMQFQMAPGEVGQQSFLLHKDDARGLRAALKNPSVRLAPVTDPEAETDQEETTT